MNQMKTKPKSGYEKVGGMSYLPRMLDKIRLHAAGELHPDFHENLGIVRGGDGFCCRFLHVTYDEVKRRVLAGASDEEILAWAYSERGRPLNETELMVWNELGRKLGWDDGATPILEKLKAASGLGKRDDIVTVFEYCEVDEGRKP
jgi:gluconokinase